MERAAHTAWGGVAIGAWRHTRCGQLLSDYQMMYKVSWDGGPTRSQAEFGHE